MDRWVWKQCSTGIYSTKTAYNWLMRDSWGDEHGGEWSWIWKQHVPASIQFFMWQLCHKVIPTRAILARRGIAADSTYMTQ